MKTDPPAAPAGYLCLVLHAHLPFVRHPEEDGVLEEKWLFEAITETYLPLLLELCTLLDDGVPVRLTMSLTPTLCAMLSDPLLQERYVRHCRKLIELAEKEVDRTANQGEFSQTARFYHDRFRTVLDAYENRFGRDLVGAFASLQERGVLEIITCSATHAFFPVMQHNKNAVRAQVAVAVSSYRSFFGRDSRGIWLPECGYYPGLETILAEEGLTYFFVDTHGLLFADERPQYGVFAPLQCREAPLAAFGRDAESSRSVWSAEEGYPGHPDYREFYRDIGFDLDIDYIGPFIGPEGIRIQTGIKYHRVTDRNSPHKQHYRRNNALRTADMHAGNFLANREQQIKHLATLMDRPPLIVAPYDAELFGHWWYEGPEWLNFLIRKIAFEQETFSLITPSEYLSLFSTHQIAEPCFSSWGEGGYADRWVHESNDWIYRHLSRLEEQMTAAAQKNPDALGIRKRALNQMARELLLAESSDWAFIMKSGTVVDYAVRRTREHLANFTRLSGDLENGTLDEPTIAFMESNSTIFPDIDYRVYA